MPTAIALHTIHRPGKTKGTQVVVYPGKGKDSTFECAEKEFTELLALGAVKAAETQAVAEKPAEKKAPAKGKKAEPADAEKADDDLGV